MLRILLIVLVGALALHVYNEQIAPPPPSAHPEIATASGSTEPALPDAEYRCDGREHCSEMKNCAEAEFFLANCPNVKMDGDLDGRPCERGPC